MTFYQASLSLRILKRYWELFRDRLNVLISFAYVDGNTYKFLITYRHMMIKIVFDSGAWSKVSGAVSHISLNGLIGYLGNANNAAQFDIYFSYDTDFGDDGFDHNITNQIKMENAGLRPTPVVHNLFDQEIDYYLNSSKYSYIALGSRQTTNYSDLEYAVRRIKRFDPSIRIHWFGGSKFEWLCNLPIASSDSTSWAMMGKFGHINYWNPHLPGFNKAHIIYTGGIMKNDIMEDAHHYETYPWKEEVDEYIFKTFGLTFMDLTGYDAAFNMQLINTKFYADQEKRINDERIRRGIPLE
jgi:hypothetical protein